MNQTNRRQILRQGAAAALAVGSMPAILAACASDDSSPSGKGVQTKPGQSTTTRPLKLTGTINFLNFEGWVGAGEIAAFEKKYPGAKINLVPWVSSDDAVAKAKNRAGDIDVLLVDGTTFPQLDALKVFAKFDNAVPNVANIDTAYKSKSWDPDNARFAATDYGRTGIAYRADIVKEAPKTWEDFFRLAETHSGKVVILDYQRSVMGSTMKSLGFAPSSKVQADIDAVKKRLIALKPHLLAISTEVGKQLANGEAVLALGDAYDICELPS